MNALIVYASNSGSTYQTSKLISDVLSESHSVKILKADDTKLADIENADLILMGSPSWLVDGKQGQPHESMTELMNRVTGGIKDKKVVFFGCGDDSYTEFCGAVDALEGFGRENGSKQIVPSLRVNEFYFNLNENIQMIKAWTQVLCEQL